jgi:DNA-binding transcriptional LysR family regulator
MGTDAREVRLPPITAIQAFEAAARLGSFDKASEELCITASAVGKRVATLEEIFGVALFTRCGRGVQLSVAGKEYLEQVKTALGLLSQVTQHSRSVQRTERLKVATLPTFARQVLVPRLGQFTSQNPSVELELVLSIPYVEMSPPETDLEIRFGKGTYAGLESELLIREPVFAVCAPTYLRTMRGLRVPADLGRATLLRSPLEPWAPWFQAAGLDWPEPRSGPRFVDLGMLMEAAVNAQGVALARRSVARGWLDSGALVRQFDIEAWPHQTYYLCWKRGEPLLGARATFAKWLRGICAEAAGTHEQFSADGRGIVRAHGGGPE